MIFFFFTTPETARIASTRCKAVKIQIPKSAADVSLVCHSVQHKQARVPAAIGDGEEDQQEEREG